MLLFVFETYLLSTKSSCNTLQLTARMLGYQFIYKQQELWKKTRQKSILRGVKIDLLTSLFLFHFKLLFEMNFFTNPRNRDVVGIIKNFCENAVFLKNIQLDLETIRFKSYINVLVLAYEFDSKTGYLEYLALGGKEVFPSFKEWIKVELMNV